MGVRAGYNVQLAVAPDCGIILGAQTSDRRDDAGLAEPMLEHLAAQNITVYTPVPPDKEAATAEIRRKRVWRRNREPQAVKIGASG